MTLCVSLGKKLSLSGICRDIKRMGQMIWKILMVSNRQG